MLFIVRQLQELGRTTGIPLCMCFIDLQEASDSVDRALLWVVLARFGVPEKMLTIIRQFQKGMRARVRTDDGEQSQWFDVAHELRRGCALSPLIFIFAAAINTILVRFIEDPDILRGLVHLMEVIGEDGWKNACYDRCSAFRRKGRLHDGSSLTRNRRKKENSTILYLHDSLCLPRPWWDFSSSSSFFLLHISFWERV